MRCKRIFLIVIIASFGLLCSVTMAFTAMGGADTEEKSKAEDLMSYVTVGLEKPAMYLQAVDYPIPFEGNEPLAKVYLCYEQDGYNYCGTVTLDWYRYYPPTDEYIGFYWGKIYRPL